MPNNKWTKTATSASLAILGVTQLNNKADANIVLQGSNLTATAPNYSSWSLDHKQGRGILPMPSLRPIRMVLRTWLRRQQSRASG